MKYLLDTQLLLWSAAGDERCPMSVRELLNGDRDDFHFSVVSIWETAIKYNLGRASFQYDPRRLRVKLLENKFYEVPVMGEHTLGVAGMPPIHKDPFDRILIAQATVEDLILLTTDATVARYPGPIRLV